MAVPTRYKPNAAPLQNLVLVHDVFQHLVQGVAHVQRAIGIGRPVVEGEGRACVGKAQLEINPVFRPKALKFRLPGDGIGTHPEAGLQQVEGVFVRGTFLSGTACFFIHRLSGLIEELSGFAFTLWRACGRCGFRCFFGLAFRGGGGSRLSFSIVGGFQLGSNPFF